MNTNILIMLIAVIVLFIAAILRSIDWRGLAVKWVGNNPEHGLVYYKDTSKPDGGTVKKLAAERIYNDVWGDVYVYKYHKVNKVVICPRMTVSLVSGSIGAGVFPLTNTEYPYEYINGRRIIGVKDGMLVASPLGFMSSEDMKKYEESVVRVNEIIKTDVYVKAIHSVQSNKASDITKWLIIAAIGAAVVWFLFFRHPAAKPISSNVTNNETPAQITPGIPGVPITSTPPHVIP